MDVWVVLSSLSRSGWFFTPDIMPLRTLSNPAVQHTLPNVSQRRWKVSLRCEEVVTAAPLGGSKGFIRRGRWAEAWESEESERLLVEVGACFFLGPCCFFD